MWMPADYAAASDETLVLLARNKDQKAFAVLVERHQHWLRNLRRRLSHDCELADDLAQQVLLPELVALLKTLAVLPLAVIDAGDEQWSLLVVVAAGAVCALVRQARKLGLV